MHSTIDGHGPLDAKLICVGEAPGEEEIKQGRPFVGASGRFLRGKLSASGMDPDSVRYENIMNRKPEGNRFDEFLKTPEGIAEVKAAAADLISRIRERKPNVVLLMGARPLEFILGKRDVSAWRGHFQWCEALGCKVMVTYHPSACLRQLNVDKTMKPGQFAALADIDIKKAVLSASTHDLILPEYTLVLQPTYQQVMDSLDRLEKASLISFDIETSGRAMTCIGFSDSTDWSICIPLEMIGGEKLTPFWTDPQQRVNVFRRVAALLESDIPKLAQNGQFDMFILASTFGIKVRNLVWDTLVAAHNLYCDLPKDLGTLISLYTQMPYHKNWQEQGGGNMGLWRYNALDALVTYHIYLAQKKEMEELGILQHYQSITQPLIPCLVEMQLVGVKVDTELRDKAILREKAFQGELLTALNAILPDYNPGSWQQRNKLFYDKLGCRVVRKNGSPTTDQDALAKIAEKDTRPQVKLLCDAHIRYSESRHMSGVLATPLLNGRMHTAYDASGTDTGRLNSKKSIFGTGTNLQNLQKGVQRMMLVPG